MTTPELTPEELDALGVAAEVKWDAQHELDPYRNLGSEVS